MFTIASFKTSDEYKAILSKVKTDGLALIEVQNHLDGNRVIYGDNTSVNTVIDYKSKLQAVTKAVTLNEG